MAYVQRALRKKKPATKTIGIEENEDAKAIIFRLLQQEQFAEEMKNDVKMAENIQSWSDIETYASKINVVNQSRKELQAQKMLESATNFADERCEVGMLWSEPEQNLPNNYGSALCQLHSLERRFQRDPNLKICISSQ